MKFLHKLCLYRYMTSGWPSFGQRRPQRFFEKGVLKFILLDLLREKPSHGYDLIREMEKRSQGFYTPSPGSIYPVLQKLQKKELVIHEERERRKTYTITDAGLKFLKDHSLFIDHLRHMSRRRVYSFNMAAWRDTIEELHHLRRLFGQRMDTLSESQTTGIKTIITGACKDIEKILEEPIEK